MASESPSQCITLHVKPTAGGQKVEISCEPNITVLELKEKVQAQNQMSAAEQRLIFKGQIMKDDRTIDSYGIVNESVLHLVRGRPAAGSAAGGAAGAGQGAAAAPGAATAPGAAPSAADPFGMLGGGGLPPPGAMAAMMNNPLMQSLLDNPELLRGMLTANPAMRELMERNPEIRQVLSDPNTLRDMMRIASNPALMREHMRTSDRALSNIEGMPEGFNALRRLHEQILSLIHI